MEGHRDEDRVIAPKLVAGLRHEAGAEAGEFGAVAVFEFADERAGDVVVDDGSPGAIEGRWVSDGFGGAGVGARRPVWAPTPPGAPGRGGGGAPGPPRPRLTSTRCGEGRTR